MMNIDLSRLGDVPFTYGELSTLLSHYSAPKNKAQEMERKGEIVRLKKGLYTVNTRCKELIANHLHGPSYVSQQTALRHYGLIPEHVFAIKSMTTHRSVEFTNAAGRFVYTHVAKEYYPIGVTVSGFQVPGSRIQDSSEVFFQIATPEKALCDVIVSTAGLTLRSMSALREYLEEDLRFDIDALREMNADIVADCAKVSKKRQMLLNLSKLMRG